MRILFHSPPLTGHAMPMLPLALALRRRGHEVAWSSGDELAPLLEPLGFPLHTVGPSRAWARSELARRWPERATLDPADQRGELAAWLFGDIYAPATLGGLEDVLASWRADMLVHDVRALAAPLAARRQGVPNISHAFGLPSTPPVVAAIQRRIAPLWQSLGFEAPADGGNGLHGHVDICPPALQREEATDWPCPVHALAAARPRIQHSAPTNGPPRLLACFGTVFNRQPAFQAVLEALARAPWPALVALGEEPDSRTQQTSARTFVEKPRPPHLELRGWVDLAHEWPRHSAALCHAGAGTLLGALAHGLPVLALPQGADNFANARALAASGAGIVLQGDAQRQPEVIIEALQQLLADPVYAQAARRVAAEMAAMPDADAVARQLERDARQ